MSKPELTAERIEELHRQTKDAMATLHAIKGPASIEETTLALIESRKQALELLRVAAAEDLASVSHLSPVLLKRIAAFLEQNQ